MSLYLLFCQIVEQLTAVCCRFFLSDIKDETFLKHKQSMLRKMEDYLKTTGCRRRYWVWCYRFFFLN